MLCWENCTPAARCWICDLWRTLLRWIGFSFPAMAINLLFVAVCLVKIRPGLYLLLIAR